MKTDKEQQMESYLENVFPEYKELEIQMNEVFEDATKNNFSYGNGEKKKYEKYNQLRRFFLQYVYGLVKCDYINEENKQEILSRFKRIKRVSPYNDANNVYGDHRDFGENNIEIRLKEGLREELAARIFYHEFSHAIIGGNLHTQNVNEKIGQMAQLTVNNYWINALLKGGFLDELFAQDVAETIRAEIDGTHRTENDFLVYGNIQKLGIDFCKTIRGCKNIKDLTIKSFDTNFFDEILSSYNNIEELQKVLTTLQIKLKRTQSNFYSRNSNEIHTKMPTGFRTSDRNGPVIDTFPKEEDILDDRELSEFLERNTEKTTSFTETLRVENNQSGFRTISRSDVTIESQNKGFKTIKRTDGFDVGDL